MSTRDYIETFKDGVNIVGKMAAQGVSSISKQIKGDEKEDVIYSKTGLYYQRNLQGRFGDMIPGVQFYESVTRNRLMGGFVKKLVRSTADRSFVAACFAMFLGDDRVAREKLKEALAGDPQFTDGYFLIGCLHLIAGENALAEENFSKCRLLTGGLGERVFKFMPTFRLSFSLTDNIAFVFFPDVLGLNLLLAIAQRKGKKLDQAIQTLEQILSIMPDSQELKFFLASFYYEAGWDDKNIEMLKDLIPENNLQILTVEYLVKAWINKKNLTLAEGILQKATEAAEVEPYVMADIWTLFGQVVKQSGRAAESAAYFGKTKKQFPNYQALEDRLGLLRAGRPLPQPAGQTQGAAPTQTGVIEEAPAPTIARTTPSLPSMLPSESSEAGTGMIRLMSRDGKVNMALPESLEIGREEGDLVMPWDSSASRKHARIYREGAHIWVEDLGSTNGSWINQHRITKRFAFNKGDNLLIGKTEFYLE